jgi:hypothetical protein
LTPEPLLGDYRSYLAEEYPDLLFADGFDEAIIGVCERFGGEYYVVYDKAVIILTLMADGMNEEDAEEWFEFNIIGAWVGECTPGFLTRA